MRIALAYLVCLVPSLASAQPDDEEYTSPLADPAVSLDGGLSGFIDPGLRVLVRDGEAWGLRVSTGGFDDVRIEVAYAGTRQRLDPTAGESLVSHGVYGVLRINVAPWLDVIEPFLYLGGGWSRYRVEDRAPGSPLHEEDNVLHIPFGLGVARRIKGFVFDIRLGIETATGANLLPIEQKPHTSRTSAPMERYSAVALVGYEL